MNQECRRDRPFFCALRFRHESRWYATNGRLKARIVYSSSPVGGILNAKDDCRWERFEYPTTRWLFNFLAVLHHDWDVEALKNRERARSSYRRVCLSVDTVTLPRPTFDGGSKRVSRSYIAHFLETSTLFCILHCGEDMDRDQGIKTQSIGRNRDSRILRTTVILEIRTCMTPLIL